MSTEAPVGYEPASHSAAKNIVLCELDECEYVEGEADHIELADKIVEALIEAGITIPDDIEDPCRIH